jgi:CBS domain-containing protein
VSSDRDELGPKAGLLQIRTRHTVGARHSVSDATVRCPRRETSLSLTECLACSDCGGLTQDAEGDYLVCAHPDAQRAAMAELMREPLFQSDAARTPLWSVMTTEVVCVAPDLEMEEVAALLLDRNMGGAPVVDAGGHPIGVISRTDLLRRMCEEQQAEQAEQAEQAGEGARARRPRGSTGPAGGLRAADVMMPIAFALQETASLSQAAALMAYEGVHRIPVVSSQGRVVGLVTSLDVARWLAERDGLITSTAPRAVRPIPDPDE